MLVATDRPLRIGFGAHDHAFEDVALALNCQALEGVLRLNALIEAYNPGRGVYQYDTEWGMHSLGPDGERADYIDRNANIFGTVHRGVRLIYYAREGMLRAAYRDLPLKPGFTREVMDRIRKKAGE